MIKEKLRNFIFFLIYLLCNPRLLLLPLRGIYLPVYIQFEWLRKYDIQTIVDVGAYQGHISKSLNYLFPQAKIYAFEPIENNYKLLKKTLTSKNITINKIALSNRVGNSIFYINNYTPASSMLPIEEKYKGKYPFLATTIKTKAGTTTLDSYFKKIKHSEMILLKIDTQGTENLILQGGKEFIKNVFIIHIETSFDKMYKNQGTFDDIYKFLTSLGFIFMGEARESQFYPTFNLSTGCNSIFVNKKLL